MSDKPELKEDERFCEKCDTVVDKLDFNGFYHICDECMGDN
jgi:hypothetical protein